METYSNRYSKFNIYIIIIHDVNSIAKKHFTYLLMCNNQEPNKNNDKS